MRTRNISAMKKQDTFNNPKEESKDQKIDKVIGMFMRF